MKLYRVYNGWMGNGAVNVTVIAEDEVMAAELASAKFKEDNDNKPYNKYGEGYYALKKMDVELICDDLTKPFASEVDEG